MLTIETADTAAIGSIGEGDANLGPSLYNF